MLRLTLLAPEIVEAILDGRQPAELQLEDLLEGFPLECVPPLDTETPDCDYAASGMVSIWSRRNWAGERWPCRSISQYSL